jgi:O-antigen ligase
MMISATAAILVLSSGIVLVVTVLLRKTDYLIFAWFVMTSLIWFILLRLLPGQYYAIVGRGIFWGLLGCVIVAWAMEKVLSRSQFTPFDNVPLKAIILVFLLWCTITLFTSIDVFNSIKKLSHIVIAVLAFYMFYDFFSRGQNNIRRTLNIVSIVVLLVSFVVIAAAMRGFIYGVPIYKEIRVWFLNPNVLGSFLFISTPLLITSGFDFRPIKRLRFVLVCIVLIALFLSFHRTSWLALMVSVTYLLWKGRAKVSVAAAIILVLFTVGLTFPLWGGDFYHYITGERYTGRKIIWQAAWNTVCDYPVLGTGLGNSTKVIPEYIDSPFFKSHFTNAHSAYLQNAVDMGFASLIILTAFYVILLYSSERIENNLQSYHLRLAVRGAIATFWGLLVHGIFTTFGFLTSYDAAEFHVLFPYILIALPFAAKRLDERSSQAS